MNSKNADIKLKDGATYTGATGLQKAFDGGGEANFPNPKDIREMGMGCSFMLGIIIAIIVFTIILML